MVAVSYNYSGEQTGDVERYTSPRLTCDIQAFENTQKFLQQNKAWKTLYINCCVFSSIYASICIVVHWDLVWLAIYPLF